MKRGGWARLPNKLRYEKAAQAQRELNNLDAALLVWCEQCKTVLTRTLTGDFSQTPTRPE